MQALRYICVLIPAALASDDMSLRQEIAEPRRCPSLLQARKSHSRTAEQAINIASPVSDQKAANIASPASDQKVQFARAAVLAAERAELVARAAVRAAKTAVEAVAGPKPFVPYTLPPSTIQAPPEGGPFSEFFNKRVEGRGIHKFTQYFPAYQRHLGQFIGKEVHIMEIGIHSGGSLDMWKSVFGPNAHVYGCDIEPQCKAYEDNHTKVFIGDQEDPEFWKNVTKEVPRIDILIDDGGHTVEQQIATLGIMLEHLSPEGVYITEDVHESSNEVWQRLKFEQLDSPGGKHYTSLGRLVASAHIYPYLLVIERNGNRGTEAMLRHLKAGDQPTETRVAVAGATSQHVSPSMLQSLQNVFPWLKWEKEASAKEGNVHNLMAGMQLPAWLFVRDGDSEFSFDEPWDAQADTFMSKILSDFQLMHEGTCCDWVANGEQQNIDCLHIYPRLLIVKSMDGNERLLKCVQHGTLWNPAERYKAR